MLGQKVPADLAYEFPTIETLARHLSGSPDESPSEPGARSENGNRSRSRFIWNRLPVSGSSGPQAFWDSIRDGMDANHGSSGGPFQSR